MIHRPAVTTTLSLAEWRETAGAHRRRAEARTLPARDRRQRGLPHPVEDFLFQYYQFPISLIENWHPGVGVALDWPAGADGPGPLPLQGGISRRHYTLRDGRVWADPARISEAERHRFRWMRKLLAATADRTPNFACHGLHEWAMVYRGTTVRHEKTTPLRLPQAEIDALVEARPLACSHFDAFRFFAAEARPMNRLQPDMDSRVALEQPGCVHANMDLYKWSAKAMPWSGSALLLDCFELALDLRALDMRASPYDLEQWGYEPIRIETPEGRRTYEAEQKRLATAAVPLRERLLAVLAAITDHGSLSQRPDRADLILSHRSGQCQTPSRPDQGVLID